METDSAPAHARAGAALANLDALQLGAAGRHHAFVRRSCQTQRGALPGSRGRRRGDPRTAWLPAIAAGHRVGGPARSCTLCFSAGRKVGIDRTLKGHRAARKKAVVSFIATVGVELFRSVY